jgi:hypothetical protein
MPYFKMVLGRGYGKPHIALDNVEIGQRTLCKREIKAEVDWKSITELSGDECERCAQRTEWVDESGTRVPAVGFDLIERLVKDLDGQPIHPRLPRTRRPLRWCPAAERRK